MKKSSFVSLFYLMFVAVSAQGKFYGGDAPSSYAGTPVSFSVLPVELMSLSAHQHQNGVHIAWETASEINNDHFLIESLVSEEFLVIGRVSGSGTTTSRKRYSFVDSSPIEGLNYYRLRQVDFDGTEEVFKTISASFLLTSPTVYPNPTAGALYLDMDLTHAAIAIYHLSGQIAQIPAGAPIDISTLPAGVYVLKVDLEDKAFMWRIRKE